MVMRFIMTLLVGAAGGIIGMKLKLPAGALFSASPGGLANIVLISDAYGAQAHIVALLHTLRLVSVVVFMPIIVKFISRFL